MEFEKRKDFLICVDSDGCAMDTMDVKHRKCFGPCLVEIWGLFSRQDQVLSRWNDINLYSMTRGVNRFKGLALMLREIQDTFMAIEGLEDLEAWVREGGELSERALEYRVRERGSLCLEMALLWSQKVNERIDGLSFQDKLPFAGVWEALSQARGRGDIVVVSSANRQAVEEEWRYYGLLDLVDLVMAQDMGSKASCIRRLVGMGYERDHVLMAGDAPGDWKAAEESGVLYYPILAGRERESWKEFGEEGIERFFGGRFGGEYQEEKVREFLENLGRPQ